MRYCVCCVARTQWLVARAQVWQQRLRAPGGMHCLAAGKARLASKPPQARHCRTNGSRPVQGLPFRDAPGARVAGGEDCPCWRCGMATLWHSWAGHASVLALWFIPNALARCRGCHVGYGHDHGLDRRRARPWSWPSTITVPPRQDLGSLVSILTDTVYILKFLASRRWSRSEVDPEGGAPQFWCFMPRTWPVVLPSGMIMAAKPCPLCSKESLLSWVSQARLPLSVPRRAMAVPSDSCFPYLAYPQGKPAVGQGVCHGTGITPDLARIQGDRQQSWFLKSWGVIHWRLGGFKGKIWGVCVMWIWYGAPILWIGEETDE